MSERTDHAKESKRHLRFMDENLRSEEFAFADLNAKEAQVHATLALVEQQRIANLIALDQHTEWTGSPEEWQQERTMRADVREGLGL